MNLHEKPRNLQVRGSSLFVYDCFVWSDMQYTLTKYLTADYLRENDFLKAYLELVDEIIFCCSMESLDVLSNMSFESMDDNYFLAYQNFFLNGLSTYDVNKLDKLVLSEWFSLLHVRGELSDIDKLLKFGGSLKNKEKNVFEIYHNADVPNQAIDTTKDGLIYLITENNIDLDQDYLISQQVPAGYRIGLMRTPPPALVTGGDEIYLGEKKVDATIHVKAGDVVDLHKDFEGDITFYRRRQFDQYYTFGQVYRSQYTINQLSQYHQKGYYFFGFEIEHTLPLPVSYDVDETAYGCITSTYGEFFISDGQIVKPLIPAYSGTFADESSYVTFEDVDGGGDLIERDDLVSRSLFALDASVLNGDLIDRNYISRSLFVLDELQATDGDLIDRHDLVNRSLFDDSGWNGGGFFPEEIPPVPPVPHIDYVVINSTNGNIISSQNSDENYCVVHNDITVNASYGDTVNIPTGYRVKSITANVGYAFAKYASISNGIILVFDGDYNETLTDSILQNYPPTTWPCIEVFKGTSISSGSTPKMQGYALTRGRTTGSALRFTLTEGYVNGTSLEYGDYFILMKGTTVSSTIETAIMSQYPARFFLQTDSVGNVDGEAFKLPQSLWSYENGVFSWLGNTTDNHDLAYYYANDWDAPVYFNIHCVWDDNNN